MKARIGYNVLTKRQQEVATQYAELKFKEFGTEYARRLLKISCLALSEEFGFGCSRIARFIDEVEKISSKHMDDEVFWVHTDRRLEQLKIPFTPEDYEKMEAK